MRRIAAVGLACAGLVASGFAAAQPATRDIFKGKVREGLYELRNEADLTGVPGMAKADARKSETRQRCFTKQDVERGVEAGKDCQVKSYKPTERAAHLVMQCKDGTATDMKYAFTGTGYESETRTTGKQEDGKPFAAVFRTQAKYLGACPPPQASPAPQATPAPQMSPAPKK